MRRTQRGILHIHEGDSKVQEFLKLKMVLNKKYRRTQNVACQGGRRTAFKTMIGKHRNEENTANLVVNKRKVLSKLKKTNLEDIKCIKLR
jgi:hypothetical protein